MAFIDKKDPVVINIKLTSKGRELLASGNLSFDYYTIGDSEIDYNFIAETGLVPFDSTILRPADKNPNLLSFIPRNLSGDPYNVISNAPTAYQVINSIEPIGFFTNSGTTFITDSNHVKQPDAMVAMSGVSGGTILRLLKAPTFGTSGEEPAIGDLLLVKWACTQSTTGHTINVIYPTPYLTYKIEGVWGSFAANNLIVEVDRDLPNFSGITINSYAGALIYYNFINYSGSSIFNMSSTEYLDESVLSFLENSQCPTVIFPFWNMTIIFTEEIAGVTPDLLKFSQFDSRTYGGFVSYIQNQAPIYKKLGVIHYTNSSPANVYGEGFYLKTTVLDVPTIMWHKLTGSTTLGARFVPIGNLKMITGATTSLNAPYYDLADLQGNVVGKVFPELKIFVIEDQELLFAMSYKSNRSWTLPEYYAGTSVLPDCPPMTPVVMWKPISIANPNVSLVSREYCHSNTGGWITITNPSETVTLVGVYDTGYRVRVCNSDISNVPISIGTYNTSDNTTISVCGPATVLPATTCGICITNFNNIDDYYFTGTAS